ncbi:hypothetical protein [Coleofasciculus sp.]|uniref:hypothetical protein n=1 Tax=Coleofasciculus sp. TaxID=3100458 RepID=UPI0039FB75CA
MTLRDPDKDFIRVNKILGKQASIGFIPANQIVPWFFLTIIAYIFTMGFFSLGLGWFFTVSLWLIVSWWLLTGNQPHLFTDKFRKPPGDEWCNGDSLYISPIPSKRPARIQGKAYDSKIRIKLKPKIVPNQYGGTSRFMPFQNETNLCCLVEINKDGRQVSGMLLNNGSSYQLVFGFRTQGLHNLLFKSEVSGFAVSIEEGMKDILPSEKITFCTGCYSDDTTRRQELEKLADTANLKPVSVLIRNEQRRIQQLTHKGSRQIWEQIAFCTWTADGEGEQTSRDFISKTIDGVKNLWEALIGTITGNARIYREQFYTKLLLNAFEEGFIRWEILLNTKMGLDISPMDTAELWKWLWQRFNNGEAPAVPQVVKLEETSKGYKLNEIKTTEKHICTVLIEGINGISSCPEHRQSNNRVYLAGKGKECGVLTMYDAPTGWTNTRQQLKWLWEVMSSTYVHNTEAWVEISVGNKVVINDNLARQAKGAKTASSRALIKGQGRDIGAEIKQEESFDAQRRLYKGAVPLNTAVAFLVYRNTSEELNQACNVLCNSFGTAKVIRERNIAWDIWLQCLPITWKWLLHSGSFLSERRLTLDTETVAGVLPLTVPRDIDKKGVEFITGRGGKPIFIDLFYDQFSRALITGESGSGKSVLGWRFAIEALANNIPVVGMDISSGGNSTFKTAIELLGNQGAYYDISQGSSNLVEPPDLRKFDKPERERRMESWKEFIRKALVAIAMGKIHNPHLAQRVDSLILRMLDMYLRDPEIIARYNRAFEKGWQSPEWQQIPTLKDLLRFCSKERLNLKSFEDLDRLAINQILSQGNALLTSRLGKAIGRPSTFSPESAVKFFALSGLSNEQDAYLMAINAHTACIRNALSHPKSLFIGDELSVLLKKDGFASVVGELCTTGRKDGIAVVLLSQDFDAICECSAGAQIMQNMVYKITGRITNSGVAAAQRYLGYDPQIISRNATEAFFPRTAELSSCWLIEKGGRFWRTRFYPGEMMLASIANNQNEKEARDRILSQYPPTLKGQLQGLKHFTQDYIPAVKEGKGFDHIGRNSKMPSSASTQPTNNSKQLVTSKK